MLRCFKIMAVTLLLAGSAQAMEIGKPAPDFSATDALSGKPVTLSGLHGKTVVLEWNNFGCPFVQKHYRTGNMQAQQKAAIADGVVWITVNSSGEGKQGYLKDGAEVKAALAEHKAAPSHYLLDHDGTIGRAYEAKSTPTMVVIDAQGMLAYEGAIDDTPTPNDADLAHATQYVPAALAALKAGKPIAVAQTRAYGCGVKYNY